MMNFPNEGYFIPQERMFITSIISNFSMIPICCLLMVDSEMAFLLFGALDKNMLVFSQDLRDS